MDIITKLEKLGYIFSVADGKVRAEFSGQEKPPADQVRSLLAELRRRKDEALAYLTEPATTPGKYPVKILWPADSTPATIGGQWHQRQDGCTVAWYLDQFELEMCLYLMQPAEPGAPAFPMTLYAAPDAPAPKVPYQMLPDGWREFVVHSQAELLAEIEPEQQPTKKHRMDPAPATTQPALWQIGQAA